MTAALPSGPGQGYTPCFCGCHTTVSLKVLVLHLVSEQRRNLFLQDSGGLLVPAADCAEESDFEPAASDFGSDDSRRKTSLIEQCLAWGGEQRLRMKLTISAAGEHLRSAAVVSLKGLLNLRTLVVRSVYKRSHSQLALATQAKSDADYTSRTSKETSPPSLARMIRTAL